MAVPNKRGRIPAWRPTDGSGLPNYREMGRFLAKVGLEVLAFKTLSVPGWNDELVDHPALDELRWFARYNKGANWPFTARTLHPVNVVFKDEKESYELLHEFDILLTRASEVYLAISIIFGVERWLSTWGAERQMVFTIGWNGTTGPLHSILHEIPSP
ncbi:hypothetical protein JOS77_13335 [Chromobacterium haemolyticum]|nr:hypothetical protein JOS77_13335 [Chromobacterium haemolyticum]